MEFKQSGLPLEPLVYKAFMLYNQNIKTMDGRYQDDYPVRVAKLLHETVGNDPALLSTALLAVMPPSTYGIIEQRFGKEIVELLNEATKQMKSSHAHLMHASNPVKLLCMASAATSFDDFKKMSAKMDRQMAQAQEKGFVDEPLIIVRMPNTDIYDQIVDAIAGKTTCPALEELFTDKLADFKVFNEEHNEKLKALGIGDESFGGVPMEGLEKYRYPAFEDTGLYDDPTVREAYDIVIKNPRVLPENFEGALDVARLLSNSVAYPNPAAIAAALVDIGIMHLNSQEIEEMKGRLDPVVVESLMAGSVYDPSMTTARIMKAPVEFRQVVLANAVSLVETMLESGRDLVDIAEMRKDQLPPNFLLQNLIPIGHVYIDIKARIMPIFGTTDLPELEGRLETGLRDLFDFLDENVPRPKEDAPKPPKNDGFKGPKF